MLLCESYQIEDLEELYEELLLGFEYSDDVDDDEYEFLKNDY
jgi:hypothetical protein